MSTGSARLAGELRVEARGVGDVGDQAVEPPHVVLDDADAARALARRSWRSAASPTALRSEVSGFFSSCDTSAAKLSIASMRL